MKITTDVDLDFLISNITYDIYQKRDLGNAARTIVSHTTCSNQNAKALVMRLHSWETRESARKYLEGLIEPRVRSVHALLVIVKEKVLACRSEKDPTRMSSHGLCSVVIALYESREISLPEYSILVNYIYEHRPKHVGDVELITTDDAHLVVIRKFYWGIYLIKPRLQWLTRHINLTKPN